MQSFQITLKACLTVFLELSVEAVELLFLKFLFLTGVLSAQKSDDGAVGEPGITHMTQGWEAAGRTI